ncbi:hypothetical protein DM860_016591 [Cuscuta australis]|uniref:Uncharacterized protein n=1 Tax=Cuscuta australis TaxID=267555 RepID=A0A328DMQ7_9ASTE|nr:hypothetical protein DM860_016591 [Cuscuta australis]
MEAWQCAWRSLLFFSSDGSSNSGYQCAVVFFPMFPVSCIKLKMTIHRRISGLASNFSGSASPSRDCPLSEGDDEDGVSLGKLFFIVQSNKAVSENNHNGMNH